MTQRGSPELPSCRKRPAKGAPRVAPSLEVFGPGVVVFFPGDGFGGARHQVGLQWVAKVPEAELRIRPWVLSRFIASLKAGPFLLILLIKGICFVKQNRPFIKTEHNFMGVFYIHAEIAVSPTHPKKQNRSVCAQDFTKPQIFSCQIPLNANAQRLPALS